MERPASPEDWEPSWDEFPTRGHQAKKAMPHPLPPAPPSEPTPPVTSSPPAEEPPAEQTR